MEKFELEKYVDEAIKQAEIAFEEDENLEKYIEYAKKLFGSNVIIKEEE